MLTALHAAIAAAAPPAPGPPLPAPATIGPAGEWFIPAVIIGISLIVDATAAGAAAKRDRIAAVGTYCGALGLISVYGWADDIQRMIGSSWSWTITGSVVAFLAHVALIFVLLGDKVEFTKRGGTYLGKKIGFDSTNSGAVGKLNGKLHLWASLAACSYVLARGDFAALPRAIGTTLTGVSGAVAMWVVERLGG